MKTILITLGDPNGLGPELVTRLFPAPRSVDGLRVLLIGPASPFMNHPGWELPPVHASVSDVPDSAGLFLLEPPRLRDFRPVPGRALPEGGRAAGESLDLAVALLRDGVGHGLLTCPLNKAMLQAAGFDFPGHTEFLAERLGVGRQGVCMHLGGPRLRVSLVTTHPPLTEVADQISTERVLHCLRLTAEHLRLLGLSGAVAVCGLNPHAGESGCIGCEEAEHIEPALEQARREGLDVAGPFPADTVFHFAAQGAYPAVLAMYHDQGLAPLKLLHFSEAVNVTLGLPYPRTSPDHGTGYDLVGTGRASLDSFRAAYEMLERMVGVNDG